MARTVVSKALVRCNKNFCAWTPPKKIKFTGQKTSCPYCGAIWMAETFWVKQ